MKCKTISRLIYLKREELSERELKRLDEHLNECRNCHSLREEFEKTEFFNSILKNIQIPFNELSVIEENILTEINRVKKTYHDSRINILIDKISEIFAVPSVRMVMVTILILILGILSFEEYSTVTDVSRLEETISKDFDRRVMVSGIFEDQLKLLNVIPELYRLINGSRNFAMLSDDWMIINKTELKSLLFVYENISLIKSELPQDFKSKYPLLTEFINRDLDERNIDELLNNKKELLSELNEFLKSGGLKNEIKK